MRAALAAILLACLAVGCTQTDENPAWDPPADYPAWTYDRPFYYRPTAELVPAETVGDGVPVFYTNAECFFIRHPEGYQLRGVPRMAVYCSTDASAAWARCGYYGVEQSHFLFVPDRDGRHWVRFVGPGRSPTRSPPGGPHRIYVVDRQAPQVELAVAPSPWLDEDRTERRVFRAGEEVTVSWAVRDANLREGSVRLAASFGRLAHDAAWSELPGALPAGGSRRLVVPPEAAGAGGMRLRVEATDKAGNVGLAVSELLLVVGPDGQPAPRPDEGPDEADDRARRDLGTPNERRPGWPEASSFLRGGTQRVLEWLPEGAEKHGRLVLEFSSNNGRTWSAVAADLKPGQPTRWTVPPATSPHCRLRIVAEQADGRLLLAMTHRFTVDTVSPDVILGPKPVDQDE